jgi:hypothetical protein
MNFNPLEGCVSSKNKEPPVQLGQAFADAGRSVGEGVRDFVRDVPWALSWLAFDAGRNRSGDQQVSSKVAQRIENFWDEYIKRGYGGGDFEFRMAAGWEIPQGIKYNGRPLTESRAQRLIRDGYLSETNDGYRVDAFRAIYLKNKDGSLEILDHRDSRFSTIVGPYLVTQIGTGFLTGGIGSASKGGTLAKAGSVGARTAGLAEAGGSVGIVANSFADQVIFKPEAVKSIANMFVNPRSLTEDRLRSGINAFLQQYSYREGPMSEQVYMSSLRDGQSPYARLQQISTDNLRGYRRDNPFAEFNITPRKVVEIGDTNLTTELLDNKQYIKAFYDLSARALRGNPLNNSEILSLRFMLNSLPGAHDNLALREGVYSQADRTETMNSLRKALSREVTARNDEFGMGNESQAGNTSVLLQHVQRESRLLGTQIDREGLAQLQRANGIDPATGAPKSWGPRI